MTSPFAHKKTDMASPWFQNAVSKKFLPKKTSQDDKIRPFNKKIMAEKIQENLYYINGGVFRPSAIFFF